MSFLCYHLASFLMLSYFATYFGQFFYILLVFYITFYKELPCSKSVYTHILQYILCWLTLNGSMLYYCFNLNINDISMVTLLEHQFYCIFSSRFIIVLLVDFTLRMASSKWKPNIQILRQRSSYLPFTLLVFRKCHVLDKM